MRRVLAALGILVASTMMVFGLGWSSSRSEPVSQAVFERLPASIELLVAALITSIVVGGFAGLVQARVRVPIARGTIAAAMLACRAIPVFIVALALQLAFVFMPVLPVAGMASSDAFDFRDRIAHLIPPALVLAVPFSAWAAMIFYDHFRAPVEGARISARGIMAMIATTAVSIGPALASATVIVEPRFAWPGVSRAFYGALQQFDFRLVAGSLVLYCSAILAVEVCTVSARVEQPAPGARLGGLSPLGVAACGTLLTGIFGAACAPWIAPVGPYSIDQAHWFGYPLPPGAAGHVLGTDENGRDLLARLLFGLRTSLGITAGSTVIATALAAPAAKVLGSVRWIGTERALSVTAIRPFAGFPLILLAVAVVVVTTRSTHALSPLLLALMIGAVSWPAVIPVFRISGARRLAGVVGMAAGALLLETTISSLGFGVQPPMPSLGNMFANSLENVNIAPWIPLVPCITVVALLAALYGLADELREMVIRRDRSRSS